MSDPNGAEAEAEPDHKAPEHPVPPPAESELKMEADPFQDLERWVKEEAPPEIRSRFRRMVRVARIAYAGPLPPASEFAAYENAVPGTGDRILKMAERVQELDAAQLGVARRRINASTIVALATILLSAFGIWQGLIWPAVPLGLGGIITLFLREISKFWSGRS